MKKSFFAVLLAVVMVCGMWQGAYASSDIENHWAKTYIEQLSSSGAIKGYPDGTFRPDGTITRAEFVAILLRAMGNDVGQPKKGSWYSYYIKEAYNKGYVKYGEFGYDEFEDVDVEIPRVEIARIIVRALGKEDVAEKLMGLPTRFKDDSFISNYSKGYVRVAYEYGIINGTLEGKFNPNGKATRAEAAKVIVTFLGNRDKDININTQNPNMTDLIVDGKNVVTSHPEILAHIKKAMEIMSKKGYARFKNYPDDNQLYFSLFSKKEDSEVPIWVERPTLLSYMISTERDPDYEPDRPFYAYSVVLYRPENEMAREMFLEIVEDLYPKLKDKMKEIIEKKLENPDYEEMVDTKIDGRDVGYGVQKNYRQIAFGISY